ncbi:MAG: hypothetical protein EAX96_03990 [Candidatus Lokiarchaeota archaeon]|nr:hypothetical protein [Candidatus Lokiarchaeota archaeon]
MKYILGTLNKKQEKYVKNFKQISPIIDLSSMIIRIPDSIEVDNEFGEKIRESKNNFEKRKIEQEFERKRLVLENLIQIQCSHSDPLFKYPIYYEIVPISTNQGTILEETLNTIIDYNTNPAFCGRLHEQKEMVCFADSPLPQSVFKFLKFLNLEEFLEGTFNLAINIAVLRHTIGVKKIKKFGRTAFFDERLDIVTEQPFFKLLSKFKYRVFNGFQLIDAPGKVNFGDIETECVGCMLPINENQMIIQLGDFNNMKKSTAFPLLKHIVNHLV